MKRPRKPAPSRRPAPADPHEKSLQWQRYFDGLSLADREVIQRGTDAAKAVCGSRLAVAKNLFEVREVLCRDLTNPKQKRKWTLCLEVTLPGLASSRSQVFRDIQSWGEARHIFPAAMLDEFIAEGYALNVRPSVEQPLGKMTEPCKRLLGNLPKEEMGTSEFRTFLSEASRIVRDEAKRNRCPRVTYSVDEKRERILRSLHDGAVRQLEELSKAVEPGAAYSAMHLRDDLELIVSRLLTAAKIETLDIEQRPLPEGYESPRLPVSNIKTRKPATHSEVSWASTAKAA